MAKLIFRYGAMNCGKTMHLLQTDYNYKSYDLKTIVIKPSVDTKGGTSIVTRIGLKRKVDVLLRPHDNVRQKLDLRDVACILVDEAQFLQPHQVEDLWKIAKLNDIPVICYGLRTSFTSKMFVGSKPLMELSDDLEHVSKIRAGLQRNKNKYGEKYCPCRLDHIEDTICPCKEYRESGNCHCKLYKK